MDTRGVRRRFLHRLGVGATIKGQEHGGLCDDGGHLYLDCSDGYMNLHMTKWQRTRHMHHTTVVLQVWKSHSKYTWAVTISRWRVHGTFLSMLSLQILWKYNCFKASFFLKKKSWRGLNDSLGNMIWCERLFFPKIQAQTSAPSPANLEVSAPHPCSKLWMSIKLPTHPSPYFLISTMCPSCPFKCGIWRDECTLC